MWPRYTYLSVLRNEWRRRQQQVVATPGSVIHDHLGPSAAAAAADELGAAMGPRMREALGELAGKDAVATLLQALSARRALRYAESREGVASPPPGCQTSEYGEIGPWGMSKDDQ